VIVDEANGNRLNLELIVERISGLVSFSSAHSRQPLSRRLSRPFAPVRRSSRSSRGVMNLLSSSPGLGRRPRFPEKAGSGSFPGIVGVIPLKSTTPTRLVGGTVALLDGGTRPRTLRRLGLEVRRSPSREFCRSSSIVALLRLDEFLVVRVGGRGGGRIETGAGPGLRAEGGGRRRAISCAEMGLRLR